MRFEKILLLPMVILVGFIQAKPSVAQTNAECERLYGTNCNHHQDELRQQQQGQQQPNYQSPPYYPSPSSGYQGNSICPHKAYDTAYDSYMSSACWGVDRNDLNTAIINFRRALRERPGDPYASLGLAIVEQAYVSPAEQAEMERQRQRDIEELREQARQRMERLAPPVDVPPPRPTW